MGEDALTVATRKLYCLPQDQFIAARATAADEATDAGVAKSIRALRKPTVAAAVVNAYVAAEPAVVTAIIELGDELRQAQADLDNSRMRDLVTQRRALVAESTSAALAAADRSDTGATLRDDVSATFDAAVAEPEIASQLGLLQRAQHWSGFGFSGNSAGLSLVPANDSPVARTRSKAGVGRGGTAKSTSAAQGKHAAERERAVKRSREALESAEAELDAAHTAEDALAHRIARMATRLATLHNDLEQARRDLVAARASTTAARKSQRSARSVLDRLERQ